MWMERWDSVNSRPAAGGPVHIMLVTLGFSKYEMVQEVHLYVIANGTGGTFVRYS
jgi:hypothetical protein